MKGFAELLDGLAFQPARNGKLRLLEDYFAATPDPDRGYALAALTGNLSLRTAKPKLIRALVDERVDPVLFGWSYDFVGDLAETVALIWPVGETPAGAVPAAAAPTTLGTVVETLNDAGRSEVPGLTRRWLDQMDATQRWALLKLITGGLRVGVSAGLAKTALATFGGVKAAEIEEVWHGISPPYGALFSWLEGHGARPDVSGTAVFRSPMLANPVTDAELATLDAGNYRAEWKWDGIRVQLVALADGQRRVFSRSGDDISPAFPDIVEAMTFSGVLDGELVVMDDDQIAPFDRLQPRLGRRQVSPAMLRDRPAHVRLYDILFDGEEDLRPLPFDARRARLEAWFARAARPRLDLSPLIGFTGWEALADLRGQARQAGIEGLMLKRADSAYVSGRPKGPWFKWKRDPLLIDAVLMYAQRGHGKRSSFYSDYTFGCWRRDRGDDVLVPVGKAYFGFTDDELATLDRWVRNNTINRFGPVREVTPGVVLEVAFDSVHESTRHKSGLAMRFPRISRIRWDKPVDEADRVETLAQLMRV